jgi:hypothetical protein
VRKRRRAHDSINVSQRLLLTARRVASRSYFGGLRKILLAASQIFAFSHRLGQSRQGRARTRSGHVRHALKAGIDDGPLPIDGRSANDSKLHNWSHESCATNSRIMNGGHQADVAEQGARRASCGRSTRPQRYLLGAAIRTCSLNKSAKVVLGLVLIKSIVGHRAMSEKQTLPKPVGWRNGSSSRRLEQPID